MNAHAPAAPTAQLQRPYVLRALPRQVRLRVITTGATLILPIAGVCIALLRAVHHGVGVIELVSLTTLYTATVLGITVGFHRGFSHRAFLAHPTLEFLLLALGSMAGQGPILQWVANHRRHHQFSDRIGDPHSPYWCNGPSVQGAPNWWHAHVGWTFSSSLSNTLYYCRDLLRNPRVRFFDRSYLLWVVLGLVLPALGAYTLRHDTDALLSGLLWGGFVRLALSSQTTFAINSIAHMHGTQPFETGDHSGNVAWLAIPTLGEAWHNNHHAQPGSAYFGHRASQIDIGGWFIASMSRAGLITRVRCAQDQMRESHE